MLSTSHLAITHLFDASRRGAGIRFFFGHGVGVIFSKRM